MSVPRKIGLFGGTFDPVHLGHVHLADLARTAVGLDEVRFIPCQISPHKTGSHPASPAERLEMLELATAGLPWAVVDDIELTGEGPNFSYLTAERMHARFPEDHLFWIMGGDQWAALPTWKHPEKLAAAVEFIVLARNDHPAPREGYRMHLVTGEHPASSTAIRQGERNHLHPAVADHIKLRGLYPGLGPSGPATRE
ncbi:MAG: nicotinate (nicotinamide) nucleotide adenylyltransferase [Akkermansiaceae bacterium]|nr:nicotinate (nicotinamide) nucleotide adenylyltransferase [Akkermansiaceae bacterium]